MNKDRAASDRAEVLRELILYFRKKGLSKKEFASVVEQAYEEEVEKPAKPAEPAVPVSVFDNDVLSPLESIVKYFKENKGLRLFELARLINRDQRVVGVTYHNAVDKLKRMLRVEDSKYMIPVSVIADKKLSVLEGIVYYLRTRHGLSYHDTAVLIRRDDRTVWTVHNRALKKLKKRV